MHRHQSNLYIYSSDNARISVVMARAEKEVRLLKWMDMSIKCQTFTQETMFYWHQKHDHNGLVTLTGGLQL